MGSALGAHILFAIVAILIYTYSPNPGVSGPIAPTRMPAQIVWLNQPGPGGGGGGGGNQMPEPPKKAEVPGKKDISVPVVKKEITPQKLEEPKDPAFNIPAKTLGDAEQMTPGMLESAMAASMISTGTGSDGGAGTGKGGGIGPGKGSGLGPGEGGGTGGGVYRPGNGVELPQVVVQKKPNYTAEAMRAKVQGVVWVDAVGTSRWQRRRCECHEVARLDLRPRSGSRQGRQAVEVLARPPVWHAGRRPRHDRADVYSSVGHWVRGTWGHRDIGT